ncbi:MAG: helix-turn-helix domain-containing protein [Lachnospiraceae bacterium]|nr:helix-turn-helix domain-containing protein [Lachnospiraceae bacterium]
MGRRSTRSDKNIYQQSREAAGLTREAASEKLGFMSDDRIEKIETRGAAPYPDEVLAMAVCYKNMSLCNEYCTGECPIGERYVQKIQPKELGQITLEVVNSINNLNRKKERLIEIAVDGKITADEETDFAAIREELDSIARSVATLQLWMDQVEVEKEE